MGFVPASNNTIVDLTNNNCNDITNFCMLPERNFYTTNTGIGSKYCSPIVVDDDDSSSSAVITMKQGTVHEDLLTKNRNYYNNQEESIIASQSLFISTPTAIEETIEKRGSDTPQEQIDVKSKKRKAVTFSSDVVATKENNIFPAKKRRRFLRLKMKKKKNASLRRRAKKDGRANDNEKIKQNNDDGTPALSTPLWYTSKELRRIQQSFIRTVQSYELRSSQWLNNNDVFEGCYDHPNVEEKEEEEDLRVLERYTKRNRRIRRITRKKMIETCLAVQDFECAIKTDVPLMDLLSELLQRWNNKNDSFEMK